MPTPKRCKCHGFTEAFSFFAVTGSFSSQFRNMSICMQISVQHSLTRTTEPTFVTKSLHETVERYLQAISHIANLVQLSYATSTVYLCIYLFIEVDIYIYMYLKIHVHFVFHLSRIPRDEEGHICCEGCAWTCMCCYAFFLQPEEFCQLHLRAVMQGLGKHIFMYAYMLLLHTYRYV